MATITTYIPLWVLALYAGILIFNVGFAGNWAFANLDRNPEWIPPMKGWRDWTIAIVAFVILPLPPMLAAFALEERLKLAFRNRRMYQADESV